MASSISKAERKDLEAFLVEHPVREDYNPELYDDNKDNFAYRFEQSCAVLTKALLEGKL